VFVTPVTFPDKCRILLVVTDVCHDLKEFSICRAYNCLISRWVVHLNEKRVNSPRTLILLKLCYSNTVDLGLAILGKNVDFRNSSNVLVFVIETPSVFCDVGTYNI